MRNLSCGYRVSRALMQSVIAALIVFFVAGCLPGGEAPTFFSPRPGTYETDQQVYINIPQADQIFYTLDDSAPADNCLEYDGSPIVVNKLTKIRVMYIDGGVETEIAEDGTFNILNGSGSGGGAGGTETNAQMLLDWIDYEYVLGQLMQKHNNCGGEPVGAGSCDEGIFGAGVDETWWICDNYDPTDDSGYTDGSFTENAAPKHRGAANGSLDDCKNEGYGWAVWNTTSAGEAKFQYGNFQLTQDLVDSLGAVTLPSEGAVTVGSLGLTATGSIYGFYGITPSGQAGNGTTRSVEFDHYGDGSDMSEHVKVSGIYNGYIEDVITMVLKKKGSGSYTVFCSDANCDSTASIYNAPNWAKFETGDASCKASWFQIEAQHDNVERCFQAPGSADGFLQVTGCLAMETRQQWIFVDSTPGDAGDNVWVAQSVADPSQCITRWEETNLFALVKDWYKLSNCVAGYGDTKQVLNVIGTGKNVNIRLNGTNLCADNFWGPTNRISLQACDFGGGVLNTQHHAFYKEGLFPQVADPLAEIQGQ